MWRHLPPGSAMCHKGTVDLKTVTLLLQTDIITLFTFSVCVCVCLCEIGRNILGNSTRHVYCEHSSACCVHHRGRWLHLHIW